MLVVARCRRTAAPETRAPVGSFTSPETLETPCCSAPARKVESDKTRNAIANFTVGPPSRQQENPALHECGLRQVFGLAGVTGEVSPTCPASRRVRTVFLRAFVPAYRCGAVLASHQVPC